MISVHSIGRTAAVIDAVRAHPHLGLVLHWFLGQQDDRRSGYPDRTAFRPDPLRAVPLRHAQGIAAWTIHLVGLRSTCGCFTHAPGILTGGTIPEYPFRHTGSVVGLLERLIEEGCAEAVETGMDS